MEKPDRFKQANPKDQAIVILQQLQGTLDNFDNGLITKKAVLNQVSQSYCDIADLFKFLKDNWQSDPVS